MSKDSQLCFVILPFSKTSDKHTEKYWTSHFDTFLKPLVEECGNLEARRSEALRGDILRQIITNLVNAPVVVTDLTDNNSNVYWELGVRQSFKHGTVTIAEEGTNLPFDIGAKGTLFYSDDHVKNADFCKRFKDAIRDCLDHPDRPDSHVLETISGRGTLFEILQRDESIRKLDAIQSEYDANFKLLEEVFVLAKENKKAKKGNREFLTGRFRLSAIELLITNRYLDEDSTFYTVVEKYFDEIMTLNDQLSMWEHTPEITEKWMIEQEEESRPCFGNFKDRLDGVCEEIKNKI